MSLYSLPCLQEVDGITVLWGIRGAAGLFPCEGMTSLFAKQKSYCFWSEFGISYQIERKQQFWGFKDENR